MHSISKLIVQLCTCKNSLSEAVEVGLQSNGSLMKRLKLVRFLKRLLFNRHV